MTTVLPLFSFCTIISVWLRKIFNAPNFSLGKFFSRVLPVSLYQGKAESLSLLLMNSLSKLETSKESTSLYNSSKGNITSAQFILLGDIAKFNPLLSKDFSVVLRTWFDKLKITLCGSGDATELHRVHPTLFAARGGGGVLTSYQIFKNEGIDRTSTLRGGLLEKRRVNFFMGGCNFTKINKKTEI